MWVGIHADGCLPDGCRRHAAKRLAGHPRRQKTALPTL